MILKNAPLANALVKSSDLGYCIPKLESSCNETYDIFDEYRYFESNRTFETVKIKGFNVGIAICEDLWNTGDNPLYTKTPALQLKDLGAQLIVNIAASPFSYKQDEERKLVLSDNAIQTKLPIVYCNHVVALRLFRYIFEISVDLLLLYFGFIT